MNWCIVFIESNAYILPRYIKWLYMNILITDDKINYNN